MSFGRALGLMTHPVLEWESIRIESDHNQKLSFSHVLILAMIPAIAGFIGSTQVGWSIAGGNSVRLTAGSGFILCILFYIAMICGVFIMGKFVDFFAVNFGVDDNNPRGYILAAYTASPLFIGGLAALYPNLWVILIAGITSMSYAVYLLFQGLPILMRIPPERGFIFATAVLTVGLVMLVGLLATTVIIWSAGFNPVYIE